MTSQRSGPVGAVCGGVSRAQAASGWVSRRAGSRSRAHALSALGARSRVDCGVPGLAKTLLVSSVAKALTLLFGRIVLTPDLLPADITGADILVNNPTGRSLSFMAGPIFKNLVLADEINRNSTEDPGRFAASHAGALCHR